MEIATVVGFIILLAAVVLVIKVLGKAVSVVFSMVGVITLVWLVVVGLRYLDERDIRQNFLNSNNLFVLDDDGSTITGFATKEGLPDPQLDSIVVDLDNPNAPLYDDYYKVIVVNKEALPEKLAAVFDAADKEDRMSIFRNYVQDNLMEGDVAGNLVEEEQQGNIEVHKKTLAFRHGVREVLTS